MATYRFVENLKNAIYRNIPSLKIGLQHDCRLFVSYIVDPTRHDENKAYQIPMQSILHCTHCRQNRMCADSASILIFEISIGGLISSKTVIKSFLRRNYCRRIIVCFVTIANREQSKQSILN